MQILQFTYYGFLLPWVWIGMAEVPTTFDAIWFVEHQNLHNDKKNVLSLTSANVNIENINNFFGPRFNKNGWK